MEALEVVGLQCLRKCEHLQRLGEGQHLAVEDVTHAAYRLEHAFERRFAVAHVLMVDQPDGEDDQREHRAGDKQRETQGQ